MHRNYCKCLLNVSQSLLRMTYLKVPPLRQSLRPVGPAQTLRRTFHSTHETVSASELAAPLGVRRSWRQKSRRFGKFVVSRVFSGIETVRNIHRGQAWASYVRSKTHIILMQIQKVVTTLGNNMMICATLESSSIQKIMAQVTTVATTENVCACMCKGHQPLSAFRSSSTPYQAPKATNVTAKMPVKTCMALINYCIVLL